MTALALTLADAGAWSGVGSLLAVVLGGGIAVGRLLARFDRLDRRLDALDSTVGELERTARSTSEALTGVTVRLDVALETLAGLTDRADRHLEWHAEHGPTARDTAAAG